MAFTPNTLTKRIQLNKANARVVIIVAVASFVVTFSLVASRSLLNQQAYQARVITQKKKAVAQLKANSDAIKTLVTSYQAFVGSPENLLGGNPTGNGNKDGDNAKLVLDALPSKYDFPALATSLEKILSDQSFKILSITGTDEELAQASNDSSNSPQPVEMPFTLSVNGTFSSMGQLMGVFEKSIRPFQMTSLEFRGNDNAVSLDITAKTFFQPEKNLQINTKVVK